MTERDLDALYRAQQDNLRERAESEDAIARHPEHIADVFADSVIGGAPVHVDHCGGHHWTTPHRSAALSTRPRKSEVLT